MSEKSLLVLCLLTLTAGACSQSAPPPPPAASESAPSAPEANFLNGWRKGQDARELARTWYLTPQGSHLLDFDVCMSIPSASNQAVFAARANLETYGFLYSNNYAAGTGQAELPIGIVKDTRGEGYTPLSKHAQDLTRDYVGMTCAACHTGDLKYNGERFLIHAGQSNFDYERFMSDLNIVVLKAGQSPKG